MKLFRPDKKLRRKKQWKDWRKRANILKYSASQIFFPKPEELKPIIQDSFFAKLTKFIKKILSPLTTLLAI